MSEARTRAPEAAPASTRAVNPNRAIALRRQRRDTPDGGAGWAARMRVPDAASAGTRAAKRSGAYAFRRQFKPLSFACPFRPRRRPVLRERTGHRSGSSPFAEPMSEPMNEIESWRERALQLEASANRIMVGQERAARLLLIATLARGHVLLEGDVGVGKTTLLQTLARGIRRCVRTGRLRAARVTAWLAGRSEVVPRDLHAVSGTVVAHRIFFSPICEMRRSEIAAQLMARILETVASP